MTPTDLTNLQPNFESLKQHLPLVDTDFFDETTDTRLPSFVKNTYYKILNNWANRYLQPKNEGKDIISLLNEKFDEEFVEANSFYFRKKDSLKCWTSPTSNIYIPNWKLDSVFVARKWKNEWYRNSCFMSVFSFRKPSFNSPLDTWEVEYLRDRNGNFIKIPVLGPICNVEREHPEFFYCQACSSIYQREFQFSTYKNRCIVCDYQERNFKNPPLNYADPIQGYHSHGNWRFISQKKDKEKSFPFGVELEIHPRDINKRTFAACSIYEAAGDNNLYFEKDGSLADGGFEIITNPMTHEFHHAWWPKVLKEARKWVIGYEAAKTFSMNYGIHLTLQRISPEGEEFLTSSQIQRMSYFFDFLLNKQFILAITQRNKIYGSEDGLGSLNKPLQKERFLKDRFRIVGSKTKYQSVYVKDRKNELIEFRAFNSTLNTTSFLKNIDFLDALVYWVKSTHTSYSFADFLEWLISSNYNQKRYKVLLDYLSKDAYSGIGFSTFVSPWKQFIKEERKKFHSLLDNEYGHTDPVVDFLEQSEANFI